MKTRNVLACLAVTFCLNCGGSTSSPPTTIDITEDVQPMADDGPATTPTVPDQVVLEGEPHSAHHLLRLWSGDYVAASVDVRVDEVPRHGLRFFALQVNFADVAWAHGGLQADPEDGRANWGGLVSGIDYDYAGAEEQVLAAVQNMPGRTSDVTWNEDTWYRYEIRRGDLEVLPAGEYSVLDEEPVTIDAPREMWRWTFTIIDVESSEVIWAHDLFAAHPYITSATYWTETGYGITCSDALTVRWRNPNFETEAGERWLPKSVQKSIQQSTCPDTSTTDIAPEENGGEWGTIQRFAVERPPNSEHGDTLYFDRSF